MTERDGSDRKRLDALLASLSTMAPWDANTYFDLPTTSTQSLGTGGSKLAVPANPMRVGLILSANVGTSNVFVAPVPNVVAPNGVALVTGSPTLVMTHADWGPLVAAEWWFACSASCSVTAVELVLTRWPARAGRHKGHDEQSYPLPPGPPFPRPAPGKRGRR